MYILNINSSNLLDFNTAFNIVQVLYISAADSTGGTAIRRGQRFTSFYLPHLKLTSTMILEEPYSIEKCATCLDTFLRF